MLKRVEKHIQLYDGKRNKRYYLTIRDNGKTYNKMFDTLEEARKMKENINKTQRIKSFKYPDFLIDLLFGDNHTVDITYIENNFEENFKWVIEQDLSERQQLVIKKRYVEGLTLESIGLILGVGRERVRQIEAKALRKLKHPSILAKLRFGKEVYTFQDDIENLKLELLKIKQELIKKIKNKELIELSEDELLQTISLEQLGLGVRSYRCLRRAGINSVADLVMKTEREVRAMRNLGDKSFREIKYKLEKKGYHLRKE